MEDQMEEQNTANTQKNVGREGLESFPPHVLPDTSVAKILDPLLIHYCFIINT